MSEFPPWFTELVEATRAHILDGPPDNRRRAAVFAYDMAGFDAPARGREWAELLRTGYHSHREPHPEYRDERGFRMAASPGWAVEIAPSPELADRWLQAGQWFADVYLPAHPEVRLRLAMAAISERAYRASWNFGTEFQVWQLLQGQISAWWEFDLRNPGDAALLDEVREAFIVAQGWWTYPEDASEVVFVSIPQWKRIFLRKSPV